MEIQSALAEFPRPNRDEISLLKSGEIDLFEALEYDPSNEYIKKQLEEVQSSLRHYGEAILTSLPRKTTIAKPQQSVTSSSHPATSSAAPNATSKQNYKWYHSTWFLIIAVYFVGIFALPLIWLNPRYSKTKRIVLTIIVVLLTVIPILCLLISG